jgi:hypothetical protein
MHQSLYKTRLFVAQTEESAYGCVTRTGPCSGSQWRLVYNLDISVGVEHGLEHIKNKIVVLGPVHLLSRFTVIP